jgi:hypothetical protein
VTVKVRTSPLITEMLSELVKWGLTCPPGAVLAGPAAVAAFGPTPRAVPPPKPRSMVAAKATPTNRAQDDRRTATPRLTEIGEGRDGPDLVIRGAWGRSGYLSSVDEVLPML